MDLALFVLKVLAVVGGAAVGALVVGLLVQLAARALSRREVPPWALTFVRLLGAVAAGLAVWLLAFGPPGAGGLGGGGGWRPFGQSSSGAPGTGTGAGTGAGPGTQRTPASAPAKETRDTLTITMRGGDEAERDQKFYVLQGDEPR